MGVYALHLKELAYSCGAVAHEGVPASATSGTIVDSALVDTIDDAWKNQRAYVFSGTGQGQERSITGFTASSDTLAIAPVFTTTPDVTSGYIILERGWTVGMLRTAWLLALRQERRNLLLPLVDDTVTLDTDPETVFAYDVPAGVYAIQHILREETAGDGNFIVEISPEYWSFNRGASPVEIVFDKWWNDARGFIRDGCLLRIIGQKTETEPTADTSTITVPTGNLVLLAAALALEGHGTQLEEQNRHRAAAQYYRQIFDTTKDRMLLLPGSKVVNLS